MTSDLTSTLWRKAVASQANGSCVEVARVEDNVAVRDSKHGKRSPVVIFTRREWGDLLTNVKAGKFA
jgi:hypothetical protein